MGFQTILLHDETTLKVYGKKKSRLGRAVFLGLCIASLGILRLICIWFPKWQRWFELKSSSLETCDHVLLVNNWGEENICTVDHLLLDLAVQSSSDSLPFGELNNDLFYQQRVQWLLFEDLNFRDLFNISLSKEKADDGDDTEQMANSQRDGNDFLDLLMDDYDETDQLLEDNLREQAYRGVRFFKYHEISFFYIGNLFIPLNQWQDLQFTMPAETYQQLNLARGLPLERRQVRKQLFGSNEIKVQIPSYLALLFDQVLHPFYVFQVCSIVLWSFDEYYFYAMCIGLISIVSVIVTLIETRSNLEAMQAMARLDASVVALLDRKWTVIPAKELVPGDIIQIMNDPQLSESCLVPADCALLSGQVLVNESMLTGESVPLTKTPLTSQLWSDGACLRVNCNELLKAKQMQKHVLYCGTKVLKTKGRTGDSEQSAFNWSTAASSSSAQSAKAEFLDPTRHRMTSAANVAGNGAVAVVLSTGFFSAKGQLAASMLYPKPHEFNFYRDSFRFICVLFGIALLGFAICVYFFIQQGESWSVMLVRALDLITIVVPPGLPAAMSIGTGFALRRLKANKISCTSPPHINVAGKINLWAFDKTGTLTEDCLDVRGTQPVGASLAFTPLCESSELLPSMLECALASCHAVKVVNEQVVGDPLEVKLVEWVNWTVHDSDSSTEVSDEMLGGSTLQQIEMYEAPYVMPPAHKKLPFDKVYILKVFDFASELRRMSVVARQLTGADQFQDFVFVKGAPEAILPLANSHTVPKNFETLATEYTRSGYRVIAVAGKACAKQTHDSYIQMTRAEAESQLTFLGIVLFENKLKSQTEHVLTMLNNAAMRTIMCTGDNALTAISVARESSLIPRDSVCFISKLFWTGHDWQLAWENIDNPSEILLGATFEAWVLPQPLPSYPSNLSIDSLMDEAASSPLLEKNSSADVQPLFAHATLRNSEKSFVMNGQAFDWILHTNQYTKEQKAHLLFKTSVYARMAPEQKQILVEALQVLLGYSVGFCGDGANDVGALKAANVGISLSEAEASVAAPFTSQESEIECVLQLLKEGRCSYVTSFSCFKYMALYSLVQFTSVTLLYTQSGNLGDGQFLFIDLCLILPVAVFMSWSGPFKGSLSRSAPTGSLLSKRVITSVVGQIVIQAFWQIFVFFWAQSQAWYRKPDTSHSSKKVVSSENTLVFLLSCFQYLVLAMAFTAGPPFREPLYKNVPTLVSLFLLSVLCGCLVLFPAVLPAWLFSYLELCELSLDTRLYLSLFIVLNSITTYTCEVYLFPKLIVPLVKSFKKSFWKKETSKTWKKHMFS